ncbi:MAG: adenylate/guanylate cyclase domain-containing protein [Spirochaetales bacterium]|nr:adenylate/guanylate cyclase domain-containing protein [Spirochaetales bacterium]
MSKNLSLFSRVGKTKIIPIGLKILLIFISIIFLSNFATNFISIQFTQREIINLNNTIMIEQLKELYNNASNQFQIYLYSGNEEEGFNSLMKMAESGFSKKNSLALGIQKDGTIKFFTCNNQSYLNGEKISSFSDTSALEKLIQQQSMGIEEGSISFNNSEGEYFGVYKFHDEWNMFIIRAELRSDIKKENKRIYIYSSVLIFILTLFFVIVGYVILNKEFSVMRSFTEDLIQMQEKKQLDLIDISKAPNDDVTYMAASFNSLSSQINNLLGTFQKFVSKDIVAKAYSGKNVGLEGSQRELTMLFSDVKSFTYRTETLGNDIIEVLNVHYNRVINRVHHNNGIIGSIIGDAVLAIYGTFEAKEAKSLEAIKSAWEITQETQRLREEMADRRKEIEKNRKLTESEEKVFKAVSVDVGVGIDGGNVFYGTIGRNDSSDPRQAHMANTVIGDTVNSASRLEGLTRIYHLPVIVSEYIKDEVSKNSSRYKFFEIDTVQVKGKTKGKKIFFPFDCEVMDNSLIEKYETFEEGLKLYYEGNWRSAKKIFKKAELEVTEVFLERMGTKNAPENWSGIWTMTTK